MLLLVVATNSFAVNVPLTIQEALPSSVSGLNRTDEIATGGIPLAEDSGITSITQLGLSGATSAQFRALGHWPNGNIKWVLIDTPLSLTAGATNTSLVLVDGSGNFGGSNLATDGSTITVSTGAATFTIKKTNFNIFDTVTVGSTSLVSTGNAGKLRMVGKDDTEYTSSNDATSTAVIEENGPVRAVVKATGSFKSAGGTRHMDYTLRLHFYKGKSAVKGVVELRNASKTNAYLTRDFKSVEAIVPVGLAGSKSVTFGINGSPSTTALATSATAYLMQGFTQSAREASQYNFITQGYWWQPPLPGSGSDVYAYDSNYKGLKAVVGATNVRSFGTVTDRSDSYGYITDSASKGAVLAYKSLADFWPGGLEFKDNGQTSIELYSKQNPYDSNKPIKLGFGQHDTRELMWNFFESGTPATATKYALEFPMVIRGSFQHYADTKALYGQSELVTPTEQAGIFTSLVSSVAPVATTSPLANNYPDVYVFRGWPWAEGGGWNQNNHIGNDVLDFLRTGGGGYFLKAGSRARMTADSGLGRSDDYTTETFSINTEGQMWPKLLTSGTADGEHTYVYGLPVYYYISGNETIKEAWLNYGDRLLRNNASGYYQLPNSQWLRGLSNTIRNSAIVYEFSCEQGTCNAGLKSALENAAAYQIDSRATGSFGTGNAGRDMNRGFLYWDVDVLFGGESKRLVHSIYHNHIHFEAMYQLWRVMGLSHWGYARLLELEDYMTGLAQFYLNEWIEVPSGGTLGSTPFNFKYAQHYDMLLDETTPYSGQGELVPYSFGRAAVWAYQRTGDTSYLEKGVNMVWEQPAYSGDSVRNSSELQDQAVMWAYLNQSAIETWKPLSLSVQENGGGSYTLSWTVPAGASKLHIKHSGKPIVDWLGFDKDARTYQHDPASYTAFFAATNITNPTPLVGGANQELTLTGLATGLEFAARYYGGSSLPLSAGRRYRYLSISGD